MRSIEYFYSAHSAFAYLGSAKLLEIAQQTRSKILHRPVDLRRVVPATGASSFGRRSDAHKAYFFGVEIKRWSIERNAPIASTLPTHHRNDIRLANCLLLAAMEADHNVDQLSHALLEAHWRDDADLADPPTLARLADASGLDGAVLLAAADTPAVAAVYDQNTAEAIQRSVFGSPTYFVDGEMFYGQDRLELVAKALARLA
jgi:2-hydroxychromene-2-carboxylate isomerase